MPGSHGRQPYRSFVALIAPLALSACAPGAPSSPEGTTGTVRIEVSTNGDDMPESYQVLIDDTGARSVPSNGAVSVQGILPGTHDFELTSIPFNCAVDGPNPQGILVLEASTSDVVFAVACEALPLGDLSVSTVTTGEDLDPDGYAVSIDGADQGDIGINDTRIFSRLTPGDYEVELTDLAANCSTQGENPRTLPVFDEQTTPATFAVVCAVTTGSIEVTVSTSGLVQDQDGYTVDLDGVSTQDVGPDDRVTFTTVAEGPHTVTLGGIAPNCAVEEDNPVEIDVTAGATYEVEFDVMCSLF